eukprot:937640_1
MRALRGTWPVDPLWSAGALPTAKLKAERETVLDVAEETESSAEKISNSDEKPQTKGDSSEICGEKIVKSAKRKGLEGSDELQVDSKRQKTTDTASSSESAKIKMVYGVSIPPEFK